MLEMFVIQIIIVYCLAKICPHVQFLTHFTKETLYLEVETPLVSQYLVNYVLGQYKFWMSYNWNSYCFSSNNIYKCSPDGILSAGF